jgi:hypothetical protein
MVFATAAHHSPNYICLSIAKNCRTVQFYIKKLKNITLQNGKHRIAIKKPHDSLNLQSACCEGRLVPIHLLVWIFGTAGINPVFQRKKNKLFQLERSLWKDMTNPFSRVCFVDASVYHFCSRMLWRVGTAGLPSIVGYFWQFHVYFCEV